MNENPTISFNFQNFIACIKCYHDCYGSEYLCCNVCGKGCHKSCMKMSNSLFKELSKYDEDMFTCSNKCRSTCLPFQNLTDRVFLDTTIGKRKLPCKTCYKECAKVKNCIKCIICMKWQHAECLPSFITTPFNNECDSYICPGTCEIRSMPFCKMSNTELLNDIINVSVSVPIKDISNSDTDQSKYTIESVLNCNNIDNSISGSKSDNSLNKVDTYSQVHCNYINVNDVPHVLNEGDSNNISVFHGNVISLKKNLHLVEDIFKGCHNYPSILAISETGLKSNIDKNIVALPGYEFERHDTLTEKGGVGLYIESELDYTVREDFGLKLDNCEDLWVEIKPQKKGGLPKTDNSGLIIGVIYRHPNTSYYPFSSRLCKIVEKLNKDKKRFMIVGDMNINFLKYNLTRKITDYINALKSSGCNIHCNLPTRIFKKSVSCIDHVYSNLEQNDVDTSIIMSDVSDHFSTLTKLTNVRNFHKNEKAVYKRKSKINDSDKSCLLYDLEAFFNSPVIQRLQSCPNVFANIITQVYQNIINKYFPLIKVPKRALKFITKPWLSKGLKISITNKNKLRAKLKSKYSEEAEKFFKKYRNLLTKLKSKAFNIYFKEKAIEARNNISKSWGIVNQITKRNKVKSTVIPRIFNDDGIEVTNETEVLNLLNRHFSTIGNSMATKLSNTRTNPLDYIKHDKSSSLFMSPTTLDEINKLIDNLDAKKAPGSDGIPCYLIKLTKCIIAPVLCNLFNVCMNVSIFPDIFKIAEVKSLFKGGDKRVKGNYRPISLLPLFSKLFEKVIAKRMRSYFDSNEILTNNQFGFRKSYSTELATINLKDKLLENLDKKDITCAIFLDLAKAFDSVNHEILLRKLEKYGVRGIPLKLLESYLSNRRQYVKINDKSSDLVCIDIGIPQGSILGPLLFLIYINDLPNASKFFIKLFADDTFLSLSDKNFNNLQKKTNSEIRKIYNWLTANKLTLNIGKSKFMIISKRKGVNRNFRLKINGLALERCSSYKYLGLYIDENLTWKNHIKHVCQKVSKICGIISKLRHCVNIHLLKTVYYALGYSYLRYCNIVWGNASKHILKPLITLQNRILRIMTFAPFGRIDIDKLYQKLGLLSLEKIHYLEKSKFMHKYHNRKLPEFFDGYFETETTVNHSYNLRNRNPHRQILSTYSEKMFKYNGKNIWNTIPAEIQDCHCLKLFSHKLKKNILLV